MKDELLRRTQRSKIVTLAETINRSIIPAVEKLAGQNIPAVRLSELQKVIREKDAEIASVRKELASISASVADTESEMGFLVASFEAVPAEKGTTDYRIPIAERKSQLMKARTALRGVSARLDGLAASTRHSDKPTGSR